MTMTIAWVLAMLVAVAAPTPADSISEDRVYELMLSDFDEALRVMDALRGKGNVPAYRLDITEGDLYFNNGKYYQALKYYNRALEASEVQRNDTLYMEQLHRLISSYDCVHNDTQKTICIRLLLEKARDCGDRAMESIALFNMGKTVYLQENRTEGYAQMLEATKLMEACDYRLKYDNLRYNYHTLMLYCLRDNRYADALPLLEKAEAIWDADAPDVQQMEGIGQREQKILLAYRTVILHHLGREAEAEATYRRFLSVQPGNHTHDYIVMPYLYAHGRYAEVIRMNRAREARYRADGDTANYQMLTIKRTLGNAYWQTRRPDSAAVYYKELAHLTELLKKNEQQSAALELAALYETAETERQLQEQTARLHTNRLLLLLLGIILTVSIAFTAYGIYTGRRIRRKNQALLQESTELLEYKERFHKQRQEYFALLKQTQQETAEAASGLKPTFPSDDTSSGNVGQGVAALSADSLTPEEHAFWSRIENDIITERLYLDPNFSRDTLITRYGISKNRLTRLFRHGTAEGLSRYIRDLRLDYAIHLMEEKPLFTIKAIATECGISSTSTFYRLFTERFGMTPVEYQKTLFSGKKSSS